MQVNDFYYLIDFVALDIESLKKIFNLLPIILGKPFLGTKKALIYYHNGVLQLSFENITIDINVFNMCKQSMDRDDLKNKRTYLIEAFV